MAKKITKKKNVSKSSVVKSKNVCSMCGPDSCNCMQILCTLSSIALVFAIMGFIPSLGLLILRVEGWIWLIVSIILGWKPLQAFLNKK